MNPKLTIRSNCTLRPPDRLCKSNSEPSTLTVSSPLCPLSRILDITHRPVSNFCSALVPKQTSLGTVILRYDVIGSFVADACEWGWRGCARPMTASLLRGYPMLPKIQKIPPLIGPLTTDMVVIRSPPQWPPPAPFPLISRRSTRIRMPVISFIFAVSGYRQDCCWVCLLS